MARANSVTFLILHFKSSYAGTCTVVETFGRIVNRAQVRTFKISSHPHLLNDEFFVSRPSDGITHGSIGLIKMMFIITCNLKERDFKLFLFVPGSKLGPCNCEGLVTPRT